MHVCMCVYTNVSINWIFTEGEGKREGECDRERERIGEWDKVLCVKLGVSIYVF